MRNQALRTLGALALALAMWQASAARADVVVTVQVDQLDTDGTTVLRTGTQAFDFPLSSTGAGSLAAPVTIQGTGGRGYADPINLATISALGVQLDTDPHVGLTFTVNGDTPQTQFHFTSAVVNFAALVNPKVSATAGISITDQTSDGATLDVAPGKPAVYTAIYNGSVVYRNLISSATHAGVDDSATANETQSTPVLHATLTSIKSEFNFTLTQYDQAVGTSNFTVTANANPNIVPLPTSVLGGMGMMLVLAGWRIVRRMHA